jgi:hypothetical protein
MDDDKVLKNWKRNASVLALVSLGMEDFASKLAGHVLNGHALTDEAFANIKSSSIRNLKNSVSEGVSMEEETTIFTQALKHFETLMDGAIEKAKAAKNL